MSKLSTSTVLSNAQTAAQRLYGQHPNSFGRSVLSAIGFAPEKLRFDACRNELILPFTVSEGVTNGMGALHGGASSTIADVLTTIHLWGLRPEARHVSVALDLTYLDGARLNADVVGISRIQRCGRSLAYTEFELRALPQQEAQKRLPGDSYSSLSDVDWNTVRQWKLLVAGTHTKYVLPQ